MVSDKYWSLQSDEAVLDALKDLADYTHSAQEQIYREASKRRLLSDDRPRFVVDQIRARIDGSAEESHIATVDVSKVAPLRTITRLCPRFLFALGIMLGLFATTGWGNYDDDVIDAIMSIVTLFLAWRISKEQRSAAIIALCLLLVVTPVWVVMVVNDIVSDKTLHHVRPMVFGFLAAAAIVGCLATLRYNKLTQRLGLSDIASSDAFQAKYFHYWKDYRAIAMLVVAIVAFVAGMSLTLLAAELDRGRAQLPPRWDITVLIEMLRLAGLACALFAAPYLWHVGRSYAALGANELRRHDPRQPILYLRSFGDDEMRFITRPWRIAFVIFPFLRFLMRDVTFEESLASSASVFGPVVALKEPGRNLAPIGAAREQTLGNEWTDTIDALVRESIAIIAVASNTPGLLWEFGHLRQSASLGKVMLVIPPVGRRALLERIDALFSGIPEMKGAPIEIILDNGLVIVLRNSAEPLVFTSPSRRESEYAEAIRQAVLFLLSDKRAFSQSPGANC